MQQASEGLLLCLAVFPSACQRRLMTFAWGATKMKSTVRKLILCVTAVSLPFVGSAFADQIGGPGLITNPASGWSGFWIGTYQAVPGVPNESTTSYTVAQLVPSNFGYSDLTLTVQLGGAGTVDFALAPNDSGVPGTPIATHSVALTSEALDTYSVPFQDASLQAGTWYWLVASSSDVQLWTGGDSLPSWAVSPGYDFPLVYSLDGAPWAPTGGSFAYELDGMATSGDFRSAGPPPVTTTTSEPSTFLLLACGIGIIGVVESVRHKARTHSVGVRAVAGSVFLRKSEIRCRYFWRRFCHSALRRASMNGLLPPA